MKLKALLLVGALAVSTGAAGGGTFCDGFRNGWQDLFKDNMVVAPVVPVCPVDRGGAGDPYSRGYRKGAIEANKRMCKVYPLKCK